MLLVGDFLQTNQYQASPFSFSSQEEEKKEESERMWKNKEVIIQGL